MRTLVYFVERIVDRSCALRNSYYATAERSDPIRLQDSPTQRFQRRAAAAAAVPSRDEMPTDCLPRWQMANAA